MIYIAKDEYLLQKQENKFLPSTFIMAVFTLSYSHKVLWWSLNDHDYNEFGKEVVG